MPEPFATTLTVLLANARYDPLQFYSHHSRRSYHPGEMLLDLGDELCEHLGWKPGDELDWIDNKDGTWTLRKKISLPQI